MREGKDSRGVYRLLALGLVLVLGAYWAGSRWGERQPQNVEPFRSPFPSPNPESFSAKKPSTSKFTVNPRRP
jgi:hypothetical protein